MPDWTEEQIEVIKSRNTDLLVSAAAGSGKTAVLVEHILDLITEPGSTVDIDELLVVTFTDAAAAEMKDRLLTALQKKIAKDPDNEHIARQITLIHTANISTIDSFCLSVLRSHFNEIDLDPSFRTGEEGEMKLLSQEVMDALLEDCYQGSTDDFLEEDEDYLACVEALETGRTDDRIDGYIRTLYEYSQSCADPESWLKDCRDDSWSGSDAWARQAFHRIKLDLAGKAEHLRYLAELCETKNGPASYADRFTEDAQKLEAACEALTYDELGERLRDTEWPNMPRVTKKDKAAGVDEIIAAYASKSRKDIKDDIAVMERKYFYDRPDEMQRDIERSKACMNILLSLTLEFSRRFEAEKRRRNVIDFSDMEHLALRILSEKTDSGLVPGKTAAEYREQFKEVMIDEYQDINYLQEQLLSLVSGGTGNGRNRFMVGDVKQSIYGFRLSRPDIFMEKFSTYPAQKGAAERCISLHTNFRSRMEVIDSVNKVFSVIMHKEIGGIEYDAEQALSAGAAFPADDMTLPECCRDYRTELLVAASDKDEEGRSEKKIITEARVIASRIQELAGTLLIRDKETQELRPARYSDIVILMRSVENKAEDIASVLMDAGIPTYTESRSGYFEAEEIRTILDYLRILDNPLQDIPMAAVLHSAIGGLDSEEMARIRVLCPELSFAQAVLKLGQDASLFAAQGDEALKEKLHAFLDGTEKHRREILFTPLHRLIFEILEDTGYGIRLSAMPEGARRKANVDMLIERAISFEKTSYKGVFHFLRYIDQLKAQEIDPGEPGSSAENEDVVRIMTIHKSKGLQFPVVFVSGLGSARHKAAAGAMVIHPELGPAMESVDPDKRLRAETIRKSAVARECELDSLGEEIRVLYVALTRAQEKLIMTGSVKKAEDKYFEWNAYPGFDEAADYYMISQSSSSLDLLVPVALNSLPLIKVTVVSPEDIAVKDAVRGASRFLEREAVGRMDTKRIYDAAARQKLLNASSFVYPHDTASKKALKVSVSELKLKGMEETDSEAAEMFEEEIPIPYIPQFVSRTQESAGAFRGTAIHRFLERYDFECMKDSVREADIRDAIKRMEEDGGLTAEMGNAIYVPSLARFFASGLAGRMKKASRMKKLHREQPFVLGVPEKELYPESAGEDICLIQGIIDVFFEEEDGMVLVDYKTDRVKDSQELVRRYKVQIDCYAEALSRLTKTSVKEKLIYSFALDETVYLD